MRNSSNDVHYIQESQCSQTDVESHWLSHVLDVVQVEEETQCTDFK